MRKLYILFFALVFLMLSGCDNANDDQTALTADVRYPNTSTTSVMQNGMLYEITDGVITLDGEAVETGKLVPAEVTSLSIINNTLYVHSNMGLQRYNVETRITEPMYYDIMDFSFAGLSSIFFINDTDLYSATAPSTVAVIDNSLVDGAYFINGDHFYYVAGDMAKALNLVTEEIIDMEPITSPIVGMEVTESTVVISTVAGDVEIALLGAE